MALDKVIIYLCKNYLISDFLIFSNSLTNKYKLVKYKNSFSERYKTSTEVLQGSNLGQLLFILFNSDIEIVTNYYFFIIYTDDFFAKVILNSFDLRQDLNSLRKWAWYNRCLFQNAGTI